MKANRRFPALLAALCLGLCACSSPIPHLPFANDTPGQGIAMLQHGNTVPTTTVPSTSLPLPSTEAPLPETTPSPSAPIDQLAFEKWGMVRIPYSGSYNSIRYITDASQLPNQKELAEYDDAYFRQKALVLIVQTVSSGSLRLTVQSIDVEDGVAAVSLSKHFPGADGTCDMATWLLWIEVDADLDYQWILAGQSQSLPVERE